MSAALITIERARELVLAHTHPLGRERVDIQDALGRVLAEDVHAVGDVPPFACSAMDGFAIKAGPSARTLRLVGESRAGTPSDQTLDDGEAIRISTGAAVPEGATAVIRQEDTYTDTDGQTVTINEAVEPGQNVRNPGEDMHAGTKVLPAGIVLHAAELGAAVAAGLGELSVSRRPAAQVLSTGDELRAPGEPLGPGEIHNSNAPMLVALCTGCGATTPTPQRLPDDRAATEAALGQALEQADVTIVSGGVSVGPHDHVKPALAALGVTEVFWGVSLQPGKPTWFGTAGDKLVFGLPGNPVSAFVTFSLFARPALFALQAGVEDQPLDSEAVLATAVRRNPSREMAIRVRLERLNGSTVALPNGPQASHIVTSLLGADALALIPAGEGDAPAGTRVRLQPLAR
ncbi:MAG TPA: gephyrin-like molybdotransferase Glp [Solirubrobacteraceae bacterium]|nr:gephyrin-like molybdotransferase Glp [Solirubrobacteraceae bacterium]